MRVGGVAPGGVGSAARSKHQEHSRKPEGERKSAADEDEGICASHPLGIRPAGDLSVSCTPAGSARDSGRHVEAILVRANHAQGDCGRMPAI